MQEIKEYKLQVSSSSQDIFAKYKMLLSAELKNRFVNIPFELALINNRGAMVRATCDTNLFKKAAYKSPAYQFDSDGNNSQLMASFPNINFYLLKTMAWQLFISAVLICISSFTYLIYLFFREKRLTEMRADFMNNMTHELKTPISSVSVALELISDEQRPVSKASQKEYLTIAQSELKRLLSLIEHVLNIAAFSKKEIRIHREKFEAEYWLQEVLLTVKYMLDSTSAILHTKVYPENLTINADKTHLTSVLHNLIENALKYNDKPLPEITIQIKKDNETVILVVKDNGRGIPDYYLPKIFDQFVRVSEGDRHDIKGHGLGLSYVRAITELHCGMVEATSHLNEGSTFTVKIPD